VPISIIGDVGLSNVNLTVDVAIEGEGSASLGARVSKAGYCSDAYDTGYHFTIFSTGTWTIYAGKTLLTSGKYPFLANHYYTLALSLQNNQISGSVDGKTLFGLSDSTFSTGWVSIGTGWNYAEFDNFILLSSFRDCGTGSLAVVVHCSPSDKRQAWSWDKGHGWIQAAVAGACLGVEADGVVGVSQCKEGDVHQQWVWGTDYTVLNVGIGMCLGVTGDGVEECTRTDMAKCRSGLEKWDQEWVYDEVEKVIRTRVDEKCLAVGSGFY